MRMMWCPGLVMVQAREGRMASPSESEFCIQTVEEAPLHDQGEHLILHTQIGRIPAPSLSVFLP